MPFFEDITELSPAPRTRRSRESLEADRFLADLLGQPVRSSRGSAVLEAEEAGEDWGEGGTCPDAQEVAQTWQMLAELKKLLAKDKAEMESNPLVIEVQMLRQLMDILDMANEVPSKVWNQIWSELKAFAACDVKPLVARVKAGEKHANAVLRVLNGLTSILQGYAHDQIDATFRSKLDAQKGFGKAAAKLVIYALKKQVPVIQREIQAGNVVAVATAFEDLKKQLTGQGFSVTGVLDIVVALGKEIIGNAIDDAVKNSARWAAKKVAKTLLGSAAKAASVIFILEELALFVHALVTISTYKERLWEFNRVLLAYLARVRPCVAVRAGGTHKATVGWKRHFARLDCQIVLQSFAPVRGGKKGEGEWKAPPVTSTVEGKTSHLVRIEIPGTEPMRRREMQFQVPPVAKWAASGDSFVALEVTWFDPSGIKLGDKNIFIAACTP